MPDGTRIVSGSPEEFQGGASGRMDGLATEVLAGLTATPKTLPSKLFYDDEGCRLFGLITELPEYYPTRTEHALLRRVADAIVAEAGHRAVLVEYGASDEGKALVLLDAAEAGAEGGFGAYVPIDVAAGALTALQARLSVTRSSLGVHPVRADFLAPIELPDAVRGMPGFGFFPGSTIGNLEPAVAEAFLRSVRRTLGDGAQLVVGADMCRDPARLVPAYDDTQGVTAAFNRNILAHVNRELGTAFDVDSFDHRALWNADAGRIEMHLVSRVAQVVQVAGVAIRFEAGESIHTENSHKYGPGALEQLASNAGWSALERWTDEEGLFALHLFSAADMLPAERAA